MNPIVISPSSRFRVEETRSPSRSPNRHKYFVSHELDPLISNLSPTTTLEALEATDVLYSDQKFSRDALHDSVAAASASERALGIRAALAGKRLKEWYEEVLAWPWPSAPEGNGFRPPALNERTNSGSNGVNKTNDDGSSLETVVAGNANGEHYYGSLSAKFLEEYEHRLETIMDDMEALDLDTLKDFVRDAHAKSRSKSRLFQGNNVDTVYNHLDDFTAVITATIMQALPTISRLTSVLSVWSIRFHVLRQVPGFLTLLDEARLTMTSAWKCLSSAEDTSQTTKGSGITRATLLAKRAELESKIFETGRGLDNMLDILEGREETIPEEWIDDIESIEAEFGDWVMECEKKLMEDGWLVQEKTISAETLDPQQAYPSGHDRAIVSHSPHSNMVTKNIGDNAVIEGLQMPYDACESRPAPPTLNQPTKGQENGPQILGTGDMPDKFPPSAQSSDLQAEALLDAAIGKEHTCPESQHSEILRSDNKAFQDRLVRDSRYQDTDSATQNPVGARSDIVDDQSKQELVKKPSDKDFRLFSHRYEHEETTPGPRDLKSFAESQSLFLEGQPTDDSKFTTDKISNSEDFSEEVETTDTDESTSHITLDSPSSSSLNTQVPNQGKLKNTGAPRPAPLVLDQIHSNEVSTASSEMSSDTSQPGSGASGYFSNMSSPEIQHASVAEYFDNPVEITSPSRLPSTPPTAVSRQLSQPTEQSENGPHENGSPKMPKPSPNQRQRASTLAPVSGPADGSPSHHNYLRPHSRVRSASLKSFEIVSRKEVRNITISRKGSYSYTTPEPATPEQNQQQENTESPSTFHLKLKSPAESLERKPQSPLQDRHEDDQPRSLQKSEDEIRNTVQSTTPQPLSGTPARSRHRFENFSDLSPGSTPVKLRQRKTADISSGAFNDQMSTNQFPRLNSSKSPEDRLEARISSILTEIPGHIKLRSGPEPDAREVLPMRAILDRKKSNVLVPNLKKIRARTSLPSSALTLAPAYPKISRSRTQTEESEVKLYHLHQAGKDVPIKLFVRLVGEGGERVMVRIGGGWADLGEYLKEYASHHGRRSVSDGRFDIQGLPQSPLMPPTSAQAGNSSPAALLTSGPNPPSGGNGFATASRRSRHSTSSSVDFDEPSTPDNASYKHLEPASGSIESRSSSFRPPSRLSLTDDDSPLGLSGPTARRKDVSPSKQAWVDGMVDQARKVSVEKRRGQDGEFGDLGTVGATKRVYMRSRREA